MSFSVVLQSCKIVETFAVLAGDLGVFHYEGCF